jgi:GNAT superfamily N-acetyltransferase
MEIRRADRRDVAAVRALRLRALESDPDAFGETLAEALARPEADWADWIGSPERAIFVAVAADGGWVGMAVGAPAPVEAQPDSAALYAMWVAPESRGDGIGSALIDAVEGWARGEGYTGIGLGVTTTNEPAVRLYERKGFADLGQTYPLREGTDLVIRINGQGPVSASHQAESTDESPSIRAVRRGQPCSR